MSDCLKYPLIRSMIALIHTVKDPLPTSDLIHECSFRSSGMSRRSMGVDSHRGFAKMSATSGTFHLSLGKF